jgi:CheY-like chemotaxis protein
MQYDVMPTVLVVDDAADTRQLLNETLKPHCVVLLAKNGEQALERARSKQPDLILLDVVMPGMSGFEVLSNLHADAATRDIPVIFLTGMDTDADVERGLQYGAVDYIRKPFVREVVVARTLQHARRAQQLRLLRQSMVHSDAATGLPNYDALLEKIAVECRRSVRVLAQFAVLLLDLRHAERHLLTAQFDTLLSATGEATGRILADCVPWVARISRNRLAIVLPDVQDGGVEGDLLDRLSEAVAGAAQECGYADAIQWRAVSGDGGVECGDVQAQLSALQSALDGELWQSVPPSEA